MIHIVRALHVLTCYEPIMFITKIQKKFLRLKDDGFEIIKISKLEADFEDFVDGNSDSKYGKDHYFSNISSNILYIHEK